MTKKENALAVIDEAQYPALTSGSDQLQIIQDNLDGEEITIDVLNEIRPPLGEGVTWIIEDEKGETTSTKKLEGILVYIKSTRAYWRKDASEGAPPDCQSSNGRIGIGDPGGSCLECHWNQYETATNDDGSQGKGKGCNERRNLFFVRPGQVLPDIVSVSATSIPPIKKWLLRLRVRYSSFVTHLSLQTNADGIKKWPTLILERGPDLDADMSAKMLAYAQEIQTIFANVTATAEETKSFTPQDM